MIFVKKFVLLFVAVGGLLFLPAESAAACTCSCSPADGSLSRKEKVADAKQESVAVFSGEVLEIEKLSELAVSVKFAVNKSWKGEPGDEVTILTGNGRGDCGFVFEQGASYLIYSHSMSDAEDAYFVSMCSRSRGITTAAEDIEILDRIEKEDEKAPPPVDFAGNKTYLVSKRDLV